MIRMGFITTLFGIGSPPPGAVTVIVVDDRGSFAAQWVSLELVEDTPVIGMAMQEMVKRATEEVSS